MNTHNFRELKVWQLGIEFVEEVYKATAELPDDEKFGLVSQLRRASISVPSNIAEGSGRASDKDFSRFLSMALSSAYELETQLIIVNPLALLPSVSVEMMVLKVQELQKMLFNLQRRLDK